MALCYNAGAVLRGLCVTYVSEMLHGRYIDTEEEETTLIAMQISDVMTAAAENEAGRSAQAYTHCEVPPQQLPSPGCYRCVHVSVNGDI